MHPAAGTYPYKSEEVTSPQKSPGATSNPPLLGHDFLLLNNDGLLDRDRAGGVSTVLFCLQTKRSARFSGGLIKIFHGRPGNSD